jgi:transketolase
MMDSNRDPDLPTRALAVRRQIIALTGQGGCFLGAALSCADTLLYLYSRVLRMTPETAADPDRDIFLLSKGHAVPALYAVLAERGFFASERLARHLSVDDHVYWHPNPNLPGVEFQSGSLGHLLSVGLGMALEARLRGSPRRVFVMLGDGELNEGSIWEGMLVANAFQLPNLVAIVDRNRLQANIATEDLIPLEPLAQKLTAFGWGVHECDGHSFASLEAAFAGLPFQTCRPSCIVTHTVRGKGLPSLEGRTDGWFVRGDVPTLLAELEQTTIASAGGKP